MEKDRILVVDDDTRILHFLQACLTEQGYEVAVASDGAEAVTRLREEVFALLLTDVRMPHIDGLTLLRQARQLRPEVAIILLTGYGTLEDAIAALREEGVYDYLLKPLESLDVLNQAVKQALSRRQEFLRKKERLEQLEQRNRDLVHELETRTKDIRLLERKLEAWKLVDRARGILMKRLGLPADRALNLLRYRSRREQRAMADTASEIIAHDAFFVEMEKSLDNVGGDQ